MKRVYIIFIFLSLVSYGRAQQEIRGTIYDGQTGKPLPGATVLLLPGERGTISDKKGNFILLSDDEKGEIIVSFIGYESYYIPVKAGEYYQVRLNRAVISYSDDIVVVGSRSHSRTVTLSPVPVDQFYSGVLKSSGHTDLSRQLHNLAPSYYSARMTYSDATDHMDPAALRGMNPDQTLILINGKRRHPSAVVNVLSVVGKGSVINDLNTMPAEAIERVEILRDGASAQYGSDAIAGVINIVTRVDTGEMNMKVRTGRFYEGDGLQSDVSANIGKGFKNGGYVNITAALQARESTNRAGVYTGLIYRTADQDEFSQEENRILDEEILAERGLRREDFRLKLGNSEMNNAAVFFRTGIPVNDHSGFYAFGGLNYRSSISAGDYRFPNDPARSEISIFPDGFLPEISASLNDQYLTAGFSSRISGWNIDFSNTYGSNGVRFYASNTINASMGEESPLEFESGGIRFMQNTTNLDLNYGTEKISFLRRLDLFFGSEFRYENYQIVAGEEASWVNENKVSFPGAQGFPGYQPVDEVNRGRTNLAVYSDLSMDFSRFLFMELAGRYENYSDFGDNLSGKLAVRYAPSEWLGIRSSVSSGFRAPALHQKYYSNTGTYYFGGSLFEVITAPNNSRIAEAFGIPSLKEETSRSTNLGVMITPPGSTRLSLDVYQIDVSDRIVLSGTFFRFNPVVDELLSSLPDVGGAQFFTNAVDTRTRGIDFVLTHGVTFVKSRLGISIAGNINETKVRGDINASDEIIEGSLVSTLFDRQSYALMEMAQPRTKVSTSLKYSRKKFSLFIQNIRFGEVAYRGVNEVEGRDQDYSAKWISSFRLDYQLLNSLNLNLGINNLFNVYPDKNNEILQNDNRFPYNTAVTQFGFNGGFFYAGLDWTL